MLVRRNARAVIANGHSPVRDDHLDDCLPATPLRCVLDQVPDRSLDMRSISDYRRRLGLEREFEARKSHTRSSDDSTCDVVEPKVSQVKVAVATPSELDQITHQVRELT